MCPMNLINELEEYKDANGRAQAAGNRRAPGERPEPSSQPFRCYLSDIEALRLGLEWRKI